MGLQNFAPILGVIGFVIAGVELEALEKGLVDTMSKRLKIAPQILWAEPGSLERSHYKGQIFEKNYEN